MDCPKKKSGSCREVAFCGEVAVSGGSTEISLTLRLGK